MKFPKKTHILKTAKSWRKLPDNSVDNSLGNHLNFASGATSRAWRAADDFPAKIFSKETHMRIPGKPHSLHSIHSAAGAA